MYVVLYTVYTVYIECINSVNVSASPLYLTKANTRGRGHVNVRSAGWGLCSHLFTIFGTDVLLAVHWIHYHLSAHFQTLKVIFSKLKALHLQAWLSSCLFIFHRKSDKTVWTLWNRTVFREWGPDKHSEWLRAGTRRWTGAFVSCFMKRVFSGPYIGCNIF